MSEKHAALILLAGVLLGLSSYVAYLVVAFRHRLGWGLAVLLFPPAALLYSVWHRGRTAWPLGLLLAAVAVGATPYALNYYQRHFGKLSPFVQQVDGETRVTLTGLPDFDYRSLRDLPGIAVLQMANPDVTDETLDYLQGFDRLRALDVGNSQVSDAGLERIARLPALQELNLARTRITDAGFRQHLAAKESLRKLDLTGTAVTGPTKRAWKNQMPQQRAYVD